MVGQGEVPGEVSLRADVVAVSRFILPPDVQWAPDESASGPEALIEFAGRTRAQTFHRPNPRTASTHDYVRHVVEVGSERLFEHATATVLIRGISGLAAAQLHTHRMLSITELSAAHGDVGAAPVVVPPQIAADPQLNELFSRCVADARFAYGELLDALSETSQESPGEHNAVVSALRAQAAARAVLPGAWATQLVVTANFRTWRRLLASWLGGHADAELRELAGLILAGLSAQAPDAFADLAGGSQTYPS
ncbi:FAD-dependent thymidylate synthase [Corynebacterium uberis]|uniref:FAD-dependent thymidylate synthase n=1 Tax=Corynebacterium TaxID=1716 RepID=UPI001D09AAEA|nr:FAD-dependent thymidylate synthase [Corynebacterium uberis]UDL77200.1 FAD-dependent thymidylate synthase [Corynebacterium uberis]UDL79482.1 FAD-dependent thymidylate synthase [Corynebacterium uberis]UDL81615.1 FAD-dependent thymidylate synthase [Corynebacterium uberis]